MSSRNYSFYLSDNVGQLSVKRIIIEQTLPFFRSIDGMDDDDDFRLFKLAKDLDKICSLKVKFSRS